jgi:hypothetical protein
MMIAISFLEAFKTAKTLRLVPSISSIGVLEKKPTLPVWV